MISSENCAYDFRAYDDGQSPDIFRPIHLANCKSTLARQICYALSMEVLWGLQKKINIPTIISPYHKHWTCHDVQLE